MFLTYIRYFLYLAWNWNIRIAFFVLYHEIHGERKYGLKTIGIDHLENVETEDIEHASIYQPINYFTAEKLFDRVSLEQKQGTFLDLGCGKGRALGIAANYGFKNIIGVDFSESLCKNAEATAAIVQQKFRDVAINIICANAAFYKIPDHVNTIFLFNPFDEFIMQDVLRNIEESLYEKPRLLTILYANPVLKSLFLEAGFTETFYFKKLTYLEGAVLQKV